MRLSAETIDRLPQHVRRPNYDPASVRFGIVHLGVGAFTRAHQAVYTEDVLAAGDRRWGTLGVSLRSAAARDALLPQSGLYTLSVRGAETEQLRVIAALTGLAVAPENPFATYSA